MGDSSSMGALVAAVQKNNRNAIPSVITMLDVLKHRGRDAFEIATANAMLRAESLEALRHNETISSTSCIGHSSSAKVKFTQRTPAMTTDPTFIFEGHSFSPPTTFNVTQGMGTSSDSRRMLAKRILREADGPYVFAIAVDFRMIIAGRDSFGLAPLYYGQNQELCAVASERKALWQVGIVNAHSFPPGNLAIMNPKGINFKPVSTVKQPSKRRINLPEAARRMQSLLEESTRKRINDVESVVVAFSGGLDSSVIAALARNCGISTHLVSVGLEDQVEVEHIRNAAEALGLPITVQLYSISDMAKALLKVLWLIEEPDVMKTGVAIPLYWSAEVAAKLGFRVLLAGQGADELFGGYHRYLAMYKEGGIERVSRALYDDLSMSYETNLQRDEPVCAYHNVELRLPFIDSKVVPFALSLPINLNIRSDQDQLRKGVLRQVAKTLDIPTSIAHKPKKAIQFAAGTDKAIRRLARDKGLTPSEYLDEVFGTIYQNVEVRRNEHGNLL